MNEAPMTPEVKMEQAIEQTAAAATARLNQEPAEGQYAQAGDAELGELGKEHGDVAGQSIPHHPVFQGGQTENLSAAASTPLGISVPALPEAPSPTSPVLAKQAQALQKANTKAGERIRSERSLGLHRDLPRERQQEIFTEYSQLAGGSILHHPAFKYGLGKWLVEYDPTNGKLNPKSLYETLNTLSLRDDAELDNIDLNVFRHLISELCEERLSRGLPATEASKLIFQWLDNKPLRDFLQDYPSTRQLESPAPSIAEDHLAAVFTAEASLTQAANVSASSASETKLPLAGGKPRKEPTPAIIEPQKGATIDDFRFIANAIGLLDKQGHLVLGKRDQGKFMGFLRALKEAKVVKQTKETQLSNAFCYEFKAEYIVTAKSEKYTVFKEAKAATHQLLTERLKNRLPVSPKK